MSLDGDDPGPGGDQMGSQGSGAGTDVEHQVAWAQQAGPDDPGRPLIS
jgi:hypothetical protein